MADQDQFCGHCGAPRPIAAAVNERPRFCRGCGKPLEPKSHFCRFCGRAIKQQAAGENPSVMPVPPAAAGFPQVSAPGVVKQPIRPRKKPSVRLLISIAAIAIVIALIGYLLSPVLGTMRMKVKATAAEKVFTDGITVADTIAANKKVSLGSSGKTGWTLSAEKKTFLDETELTMEVLSYADSEAYAAADGDIIGSVMEIKAFSDGQPVVYLNHPATLSMQIPSSGAVALEKADYYVAGCLVQDEWIYVHPLAADLVRGVITFETDHFTPFAVLSLDEQAFVKKLAVDYAKREWSKGNSKEQVMTRMQMTIRDALAEVGIEDEDQQDAIILTIKQSNKYDAMVTAIEKGEAVDLNKQCVEMTSDAILSRYTVPGIKLIPVIGMGSSLFQGTLEMERGNYGDALVEYTKALAKAFPPTRMLNTTIEGISFAGILTRDWDRFSESISYRIFCEYIDPQGNATSINATEWERVLTELYGSLAQAELEALKQYCQAENVALESLVDDREQVSQIFETYSEKLKQRYSERYQLELNLAGHQAAYAQVVEGMIEAGLFQRGSVVFPVDMDIRDRVDQLFSHRQYILDLFGGTMPVLSLGESSEDNLNEAIAYALICRGDTGMFFSWLAEKGYIVKKTAAPTAAPPAADPGDSFTAVHQSTHNRNYTGRLEIGLDQAVKQAGSLVFSFDENNNLSVTIPGAEFERGPSDNDAFKQSYIVDPISIHAVPDKDDQNLWTNATGTFNVRVRLVPTHAAYPEDGTMDVEYPCSYSASIRVDDDSSYVTVNLSIQYDTIVNGAQDGEREYNGIELTFKR